MVKTEVNVQTLQHEYAANQMLITVSITVDSLKELSRVVEQVEEFREELRGN